MHLLALEEERLEIIELEVSDDAPTVGERVGDIALPEGSLIISVLRGGSGFVPKADTVIEAGDEVLLVLDPGLEEAITAYFAPNGQPGRDLTVPRPGAPGRRPAAVRSILGHALSGIVQLAVTPGSGPGDWGSSPCPGVRWRPGIPGRFALNERGDGSMMNPMRDSVGLSAEEADDLCRRITLALRDMGQQLRENHGRSQPGHDREHR